MILILSSYTCSPRWANWMALWNPTNYLGQCGWSNHPVLVPTWNSSAQSVPALLAPPLPPPSSEAVRLLASSGGAFGQFLLQVDENVPALLKLIFHDVPRLWGVILEDKLHKRKCKDVQGARLQTRTQPQIIPNLRLCHQIHTVGKTADMFMASSLQKLCPVALQLPSTVRPSALWHPLCLRMFVVFHRTMLAKAQSRGSRNSYQGFRGSAASMVDAPLEPLVTCFRLDSYKRLGASRRGTQIGTVGILWTNTCRAAKGS